MSDFEALERCVAAMNILGFWQIENRFHEDGTVTAGAWPKMQKWVGNWDDPSIIYGHGQDIESAYIDLAIKLEQKCSEL